MSKDNFETIVNVAERAEELGVSGSNRFTLIMDLEIATEKFNLRLEELLKAKNTDFIHDICGIQKNINRKTMQFEGFFVPRYSSV